MTTISNNDLRDELFALLFLGGDDWDDTSKYTKARIRLLDGWVLKNKTRAKDIFPLIKFGQQRQDLEPEILSWLAVVARKNPSYGINLTKLMNTAEIHRLDDQPAFDLLINFFEGGKKEDFRNLLRTAEYFLLDRDFTEKHKTEMKNLIGIIQSKAQEFGKTKELSAFIQELPGPILRLSRGALDSSFDEFLAFNQTLEQLLKQICLKKPSVTKMTELINSLDAKKLKDPSEMIESEDFLSVMSAVTHYQSPERLMPFLTALKASDPAKIQLFIPDPDAIATLWRYGSMEKTSVDILATMTDKTFFNKVVSDVLRKTLRSATVKELPNINMATKTFKSMRECGIDVQKMPLSLTFEHVEEMIYKGSKKFYEHEKVVRTFSALADTLHPSFGGTLNALANAEGAKDIVPSSKAGTFVLSPTFKKAIRELRYEDDDHLIGKVEHFMIVHQKQTLTAAALKKTGDLRATPKRKM